MESLKNLKPFMHKEVRDEQTGMHGFVVIDKKLHGSATGGIRIATDVTLEEVANLAHEMTLKFSFLNIKKDGAKAGIVLPGNINSGKKQDICRAFGSAIKEFIQKGIYFPGKDIGVNADDFAEIRYGSGQNSDDMSAHIPSDYFTALTVFLSLQTLVESQGLLLDKTTVLIEGFGKVAEELANLLVRAGVTIRGLSTLYGGVYNRQGLPIDEVIRSKQECGDRWVLSSKTGTHIDRKELLVQEADVLIPGARPDSINEQNVHGITAHFIVPIANIPATEEIEQAICKRGIIYVPGFVTNSGGVLSYFFAEQSFDIKSIEKIIRTGFPHRLNALIKRASAERKSIARVARMIAEEQFLRMIADQKRTSIQKISVPLLFWLLYKFLSKVRIEFVMKGFAQQYIISKHFK